MKRILAITLTLVMLLAALTGCMASQNQPISGADLFSQKKIQTITFSSDPNGYQYSFNGSAVQKICDFFSSLSFTIDESPDPSDVTGMGWDMTISYEDEHSETIVFPPNRTYLLKNSTKYKLTSNAVIEIDTLIDELKESQTYHSSCLLTIAETLPSCLVFEYKDEKPYCFYAYDTEGHLYRVIWDDFTGLNEKDVVVVDHNDNIKKLDYVNPPGGWSPKYEVTAISVKKEINPEDYLVSHIQIKSGDNTIRPFGSLLWSKTDNGDGTFTELNASMLDTVEIINLYANIIPKLILDESVSYLVQANGSVENVYLFTSNGETYTKYKTTFDALSNLADGTYYIALNVLLGGNCDPDALQNSYRYEDVFCLVVGDDDNFHDDGIPPYDAMLNLEVWNGKFEFQRIATTPCIVYSNTPINDMSKGTVFEDRHDILTTIFQAMHGKDAIMDTPECEFSRYIYMFDNEREDIPWHYRFAIHSCGAVMITNNEELICTIKLDEEEIQSVLNSFESR